MAFDVGAGRGVRPTMNVTPLVDVVLVLLIIFMVVTPMLTRRMWMHVPPKAPPTEAPLPDQPPPPPIVLTVARSGDTLVNGESIPRAELVARVQRMLNARADKVVFFDAEKGVRFGAAVDVMDLLRGGGVNDVAVLAEALPSASP